jgi:hypothetical protein
VRFVQWWSHLVNRLYDSQQFASSHFFNGYEGDCFLHCDYYLVQDWMTEVLVKFGSSIFYMICSNLRGLFPPL